jgi:hypothetical protein
MHRAHARQNKNRQRFCCLAPAAHQRRERENRQGCSFVRLRLWQLICLSYVMASECRIHRAPARLNASMLARLRALQPFFCSHRFHQVRKNIRCPSAMCSQRSCPAFFGTRFASPIRYQLLQPNQRRWIPQLDEDLCTIEEGLHSRAQQAVQLAERASLGELRGEMLRDAGLLLSKVPCCTGWGFLPALLTPCLFSPIHCAWFQEKRTSFLRTHARLLSRCALSCQPAGNIVMTVCLQAAALQAFLLTCLLAQMFVRTNSCTRLSLRGSCELMI